MSKASPAGRSWPRLPDLDLIASQARLIIRHSCKFTAAGFLQFLLSPVVTGLASLNQIAGDLKHRGHPGGARQPLHPRCNIRSTAFLTAVLGDLLNLVLRDMGYFSLSEFTAIELLGAWWLTRPPLTTGAMLVDGRSLEKHLLLGICFGGEGR
jgi:hypothetical protein